MAYITTQEVKNIRAALKAKYPDFKFSVTGGNSMKVRVTIVSGPIDFAEYTQTRWSHQVIEGSKESEMHSEFFKGVFNIIRSQNYYDESDIASDYFNVAYYYSLDIGTYDKPYVQK